MGDFYIGGENHGHSQPSEASEMEREGENPLPRNLPEDEKREQHPAHASFNLRPWCVSSFGRVPVRPGGGREKRRLLSASSTLTDWRGDVRHVLVGLSRRPLSLTRAGCCGKRSTTNTCGLPPPY